MFGHGDWIARLAVASFLAVITFAMLGSPKWKGGAAMSVASRLLAAAFVVICGMIVLSPRTFKNIPVGIAAGVVFIGMTVSGAADKRRFKRGGDADGDRARGRGRKGPPGLR